MLQKTITILFTLVCADQLWRIEIHDPATTFQTDFTEDTSCSGHHVACTLYTNTNGWKVTSAPTQLSWGYSADCWGLWVIQSDIE